jgi:pimeloyl-ACP methyl ester carboxylesterase
MLTVTTQRLDIVYESGGPPEGRPVLLLHGWPDDVRGWRGVTPHLEAAGCRWVAPWLRGFGPTRFRSPDIVRDGTAVALAEDAFALAGALCWNTFAVVGHDWGGRAAYHMAALRPERIESLTVLAIGYAPRGLFTVPSFAQARNWWYQWLMTTEGGAKAVGTDPIGFARLQWDTWSPPGWFEAAEFEATAESFRNPDWVAVTLNGYRSRWMPDPGDPGYEPARARIAATERLAVPTLLIQGGADSCDPPGETAEDHRFFTGGHDRVVLDGVGHFPAREAASRVSQLILRHLSQAR